VDSGLSPANGAIKRHKATVIIEAATSADTRNQSPSKSPIEAAVAKVNHMVSSHLRNARQQRHAKPNGT
jgi:hypothetical protein